MRKAKASNGFGDARKDAVKKFLLTMRDDANDTLLFRKLEENALKYYPNPDRIGCPDGEILEQFVDRPNEITVQELNGNHIYECRECTLRLKELRALREERLRRNVPDRIWAGKVNWIPVAALASICLAVLIGSLAWRSQGKHTAQPDIDASVVTITLDLSREGTPRGAEPDGPARSLSLPKRMIDLSLILPYYSPAGEYRIAVAANGSADAVELERHGTATALGSRTELHLTLDLRRTTAGNYRLRTIRVADGAENFYNLDIR